MTNINLLPWRESKREQDKKLFLTTMIVVSIVVIVIMIACDYFVNGLIDSQTLRNQRIKNEIIILDNRLQTIKELKKIRLSLIFRMKIVKNLESTRPLTVHLFDEIIKIMPAGVVVTKIERVKYDVTISGYAESNANISDLMRNIEHNQWIQNPELTEIKKAADSKKTLNNEFKLSFLLRHETIQNGGKT